MTDREPQQHVQNALDWEPSIDAADIGVSVDNGVVTLRGDVRSYSEKATAERVALGVYGVKVCQATCIRPSSATRRSARRGQRPESRRSRTISPSFHERSRS
jgi:hypothetical protein